MGQRSRARDAAHYQHHHRHEFAFIALMLFMPPSTTGRRDCRRYACVFHRRAPVVRSKRAELPPRPLVVSGSPGAAPLRASNRASSAGDAAISVRIKPSMQGAQAANPLPRRPIARETFQVAQQQRLPIALRQTTRITVEYAAQIAPRLIRPHLGWYPVRCPFFVEVPPRSLAHLHGQAMRNFVQPVADRLRSGSRRPCGPGSGTSPETRPRRPACSTGCDDRRRKPRRHDGGPHGKGTSSCCPAKRWRS